MVKVHVLIITHHTKSQYKQVPLSLSLRPTFLTPKWLGHFFENMILFRNVFQLHKCDIFYMKLVQYNECLVSIVDTDGLVP